MHLKNFPKRLDSKTSSLRITVPENLDLALEGLIRKVLREQPKTDHIHAFAAEYFETLLKIRDKAGAKYTSEQLCPFHNDEDAHEMIKLANTFNKPSKSRKDSPQAKDKMAEGGVSSNRSTGRPKAKHGKQTTPDLIKKLPGNRPEPKDRKEESEKENHEEELLTGDPIKELVEKELEMEALAKRTEGEVKEDNGRSEARERATIGEPEEQTEETVKIPAPEETVVKDKHPADGTETKKTEETPIEEKLTNGQTVEDKPSTAEKDSELTDEISAAEEEPAVKKDDGDKLPTAKEDGISEATDEANMKLKNGDGGTETVLEEAKDEEKELENSPRQLTTGNDGTEPQPEERLYSTKEDKAAEVQEKSEIEAEEASVVEETLKSASAPREDTDEQKITAESASQQQKQSEAKVERKEQEQEVEQKQSESTETQKEPEAIVEQKQQEQGAEQGVEQKQSEAKVERKEQEQGAEQKQQEPGAEQKQQEQGAEQKQPEAKVEQKEQPEPEIQQEQPEQGMEEKQPKSGRKNSESEEKPPTEEDSPEKTETTKPEKEEKSETEEGVTTSKENAFAAEAEEMTPTAEEMPSKEDEPGLLKPEEDDRVNGLDQSEQQEKDGESKEDATATEKLLKESDDKTAVGEEAGKDEGDKSGEEAEDASPSTNGTVAVEKLEEHEPQADTKTDIKETQNEKQKDELNTTLDIQQGATEDEQKDDTKQQEEELCTVVDSHHIIRIEEPEADTGVVPSPEEVQIKTIQTHYYDALQVPEIVTKEFRVHNVGAPGTEDSAKVEEDNIGHAEDAAEVEENNSGHAEDAAEVEEDNIAHAEDAAEVEENNSGHAEDAAEVEENNSGHAEDAQIDGEGTETADSAEKRPDDIPLLVATPGHQELLPDSVRSEDLLDLMTPTSGYSLNLSEISWQTVSGLFLDSERQHSSQLSDELRYKTVIGKPEERADEIEEVFHRTVVPTLVGAVPMPPRDAEEIEKEESDSSPEEKKDKKRKLEDVSNSKSFDSDTPFISVEVKTVIETQVLDDEDEEDGRPRVQLMVQATVDVEDTEETTKRQQNLPEGEEKEMPEGQEKGCSGESDSTMSSAATEIKRSDSGRRAVGAPGSLMQSQSLDLGGRNPLLRTRSLSTFRHGVTDFEVWNAIEKELEDAAAKIQAKFRSYKARKKLQREDAVQITTEESSRSTTPAEADERQQSTGEFHDSIVLSDHPR